MEALICPQCGGSISNYSPDHEFATCSYCSTRFLIGSAKLAPIPDLFFAPARGPRPQAIFIAIGTVAIIFGGLVFFSLLKQSAGTTRLRATAPLPIYSPGSSPRVATPTPDMGLLDFGGEGSANGQFKDPNAIAVDAAGRIYVGDRTLRLQQFDANGTFIRSWQLPAKTSIYSHARQIYKIVVNAAGKIFVAVGGAILVYDQTSEAPLRTIHVAPDYIQDFVPKKDGGMLLISRDDHIESLNILSPAGKTTARIRGFHTNAADAQMTPAETGMMAIRAAVNSAGDIFSVYAFGALGSYSLSYNADELLIQQFTPSGKFVNKFVESMASCCIAVDSSNRIYVSEGQAIKIYTDKGDLVNSTGPQAAIEAFTLDGDNNVYVVYGNRVRKLPPVL